MKTIILGYATDDAKGPATVIAGPEVSIVSQNKLMAEIKGTPQRYPEGIVRVEYCELIPRNIGVLIPTQPQESQPKKTTKKHEKNT